MILKNIENIFNKGHLMKKYYLLMTSISLLQYVLTTTACPCTSPTQNNEPFFEQDENRENNIQNTQEQEE